MDTAPCTTSANDIGTSHQTPARQDTEVAIHRIPSDLPQLQGLRSHGPTLQLYYFPLGQPETRGRWLYFFYICFKPLDSTLAHNPRLCTFLAVWLCGLCGLWGHGLRLTDWYGPAAQTTWTQPLPARKRKFHGEFMLVCMMIKSRRLATFSWVKISDG